MKKKIIKIIILLLLMTILNNFSYLIYASTLTKENLKKSLENVLTSQVKIETKGENGSSTVTLGQDENEKITVEDSKIKYIIEQNSGFDINYSIENGKCIFKTVLDYDGSNVETDDQAITKVVMCMIQYNAIQECYIAVSDAMGVDNSLAYTYFSQKYNETNKISNEVYNLTKNENETSMEINLEIDIEALSKLDSSKLDAKSFSTVTISKTESEKEKEEIKEEEKKEIADTTIKENSNNPMGNQDKTGTTPKISNPNDNTKAKSIIPKTGRTVKINIAIMALLIIAVVTYKKTKQYKDIK